MLWLYINFENSFQIVVPIESYLDRLSIVTNVDHRADVPFSLLLVGWTLPQATCAVSASNDAWDYN